MRQRLFLTTLVIGILSLVGGVFLTRLNWRPDIPPFGRDSRMSDVWLRPEKYAAPRAVARIRLVNAVGVLFLLLAVSVLVSELFHDLSAN